MRGNIQKSIEENIKTTSNLIDTNISNIEESCRIIINAIKDNKKLFIFGNGGSAADSQHIAAEFINKFNFDRKPLPAIALTTDASIITSISNDSSFSFVFQKQIEALADKGDVALAITTSDMSFKKNAHSSNIAFALKTAKNKGMKTIGLVSLKSRNILKYLDQPIIVHSKNTARIQEVQILVAHIICEVVEKELFKKEVHR